MTLVWTENLLMILLSMIPLDFSNNIGLLVAPSKLTMESINMQHTLSWPPLQASCDSTVLYSVQYQGEFELFLRNGSWVNAIDCQQIPQTHCDLTFDLGSDSDYNLQVRAQCGTRLSPWTKLSRPFNRRDTVLTVPEMTVMAVGGVLQVSFSPLPLIATISVMVSKKGFEHQTVRYSMPSEQRVMSVAALQEESVYCVRAQIVLESGAHSGNTDTQCVTVTGPQTDAWRRPTTVAMTVIFTGGLLFALFGLLVHCQLDDFQACFQKEPLPTPLKGDWGPTVKINCPCEETYDEVRIHSERTPDDLFTTLLENQL
ncbi:interleukin-20 receptor subunit beta isoform X2 [Gouania willdenowi]|uniref:Fibronectin type-III domain-containing protein n=1 Tax=Gouania willdenowi TaxID=441366 RepID=A0A8C5H668_GOUWI|nr:interleukin-20 receptor subunit beta isoform X2 [Gouania willdenowi]XP_028328636.1 interleukin-20 receptor subunit beta isoform X2 [Gouania willdenowi]